MILQGHEGRANCPEMTPRECPPEPAFILQGEPVPATSTLHTRLPSVPKAEYPMRVQQWNPGDVD